MSPQAEQALIRLADAAERIASTLAEFERLIKQEIEEAKRDQ